MVDINKKIHVDSIDLLHRIIYEEDWRLAEKILINIAKFNPDVLINAYEGFQGTVNSEILQFLREGMKIHAIKKRRELTGEGLKESKAYVDDLQVEMGDEYNSIKPHIDNTNVKRFGN